jgi:hypothetical protein
MRQNMSCVLQSGHLLFGYPVLNDPVWLFLEEVRFAAPRGANEGAKYIHLAKTLRASLLDNPAYAENLAELDTDLAQI